MNYKHFILIALLLSFLILSAQTPFDAFSPETSRIILDGDSIAAWRAEQQSHRPTHLRPDTILCALIADLRNEQLLLVDIASHRPVTVAPFTDEIKKWLSVDPLVDKNITTSPYLYCNGNPIMFIDPDGRDWYGAEDGSIFWTNSSEQEIVMDGITYSNKGTDYSYETDNYTIYYEQNVASSITEYILHPCDFESQMLPGGKKKEGDAGICFNQSGLMVQHSGAISQDAPKYNIANFEEQISYAASQLYQGFSVRVHVDRTNDDIGDHWVALSSITTNLPSHNIISFGFYDPGTARIGVGTSNLFFIDNEAIQGITNYSHKTYKVVHVRRNK